MKVFSFQYIKGQLLAKNLSVQLPLKADLVLAFGTKELISDPAIYAQISESFQGAQLAMCSTAGEIQDANILDHQISITAICFENTAIKSAQINVNKFNNSYDAGRDLVQQLDSIALKHIFVLSDGSIVNGSELVRGIRSQTSDSVSVSGGLAGDGTNFHSTAVGLNSLPGSGNILAIGFYGDHIKISNASDGGWEMFGLERLVTKSQANKLYEIDSKDALSLYKLYLGKYAKDLPGSALLFPLSVRLPNHSEPVVRTILSIDTNDNAMVFAGDVPEGSKVRFMKANFDNLIEAASIAAQRTNPNQIKQQAKLAILISCVGRKIILNKRVEEELEAVKDILGSNTTLTGFYSYGEISPLLPNSNCELHNQTMTITTFDEI